MNDEGWALIRVSREEIQAGNPGGWRSVTNLSGILVSHTYHYPSVPQIVKSKKD